MDQMLDTLHHDFGINTQVIPGEAPWKLSITGVIMRLVKRTAHMRWIRDEMFLVKSVFCKLWWLIHVFSNTENTLLCCFNSDTNQFRLKEKRLTMNNKIAVFRFSMPEKLAKQQSTMKAWLQAETESRVERAQI